LDRRVPLLARQLVAIHALQPGLLSEWHGDCFVALDVHPGTGMSPVFALLQREVDEAGAFWEWAYAIPLSTTRS
jgi:hypothetical protein